MKKQILKLLKSLSIICSMMLFTLGTYNAVFMSSLDFMSDSEIKFAKRLDEMNGRIVAAQAPYKEWAGLIQPKVEVKKPLKIVKKVMKVSSKKKNEIKKEVNVEKYAETTPKAEPAINTSLDLQLVELFNVKKYQKPLSPSDFKGELFTANGVIENLNVQLPNNEAIDISYAELSGNVFSYEYDSQKYSGMMYEVGKGTFMVTLTNGPFAGTRMKFLGNNNDVVEETYSNDVAYAQDSYDQDLEADRRLQEQSLQANAQGMPQNPAIAPGQQFGFNFQQQSEI